jgi:hypothetical protein
VALERHTRPTYTRRAAFLTLLRPVAEHLSQRPHNPRSKAASRPSALESTRTRFQGHSRRERLAVVSSHSLSYRYQQRTNKESTLQNHPNVIFEADFFLTPVPLLERPRCHERGRSFRFDLEGPCNRRVLGGGSTTRLGIGGCFAAVGGPGAPATVLRAKKNTPG